MNNKQRVKRKPVRYCDFFTHFSTATGKFFYVSGKSIYILDRLKNTMRSAHLSKDQFFDCPSIIDRKTFFEVLKKIRAKVDVGE